MVFVAKVPTNSKNRSSLENKVKRKMKTKGKQ